ncbi:MAG: hypothetical protein APF76_12405 [Desulfitibacter sp. BRH_c19]|nr:MAG: hypothetical protein APF76_12405 [Desulfitibacter sp. BRH_c19]
MRNLLLTLVLCVVLVLVGAVNVAAQNQVTQGDNTQTNDLENSSEAIIEDFFSNITQSVDGAIHEITSISGNELFFYLGRPFIPFINWYWFLAANFFFMVIFLALAVLNITFFPRNVKLVGQAITTDLGLVLGRGLLAAILMGPAMLLLAITIIGIPAVMLLFGAASIMGYTAIAWIIGEKMLRGSNSIVATAVGVLLVGVLTIVPVLGWLLALVLLIVALGAVVTTRFGTVSPKGKKCG